MLGLLAVVASTPVTGKERPKPITIAILDAVDRQGYVDPANVDSLRDIEKELRGCPTFRVVPRLLTDTTTVNDHPRLRISVWRSIEKTDGAQPTLYESLRTMTSVQPRLRVNNGFQVEETEAPYFKLLYQVGGQGRWRYAAKKIVEELRDWAEANREKLTTDWP